MFPPKAAETGSGAPIEALVLEPAAAAEARRQRDRHVNTVTVPRLRLIGFGLLAAGVACHNLFILGALALGPYLAFVAALGVYGFASGWALRRFYGRTGRTDLGLAFLLADLVPFTAAVHVTGGTRSWAVPVLFAHALDQVGAGPRRVVLFATAGLAGYLALLGYLRWVDGAAIDWALELTKIGILYALALYGALTARSMEARRGRTAEAVRMARRFIAELQEKTRQLNQARRRAEEASRAKSEFLSRVSHELRTPLNAILGFAQLLEGQRLDPAQREEVQHILAAGRHLLEVIDDVLEITRVEAGGVTLAREPVAVRELVDEVLAFERLRAEERGIELAGLPAEAGDPVVVTDRLRLRQVLLNLVSNAIKYNRPGGRVEVRCQAGAGRLWIAVVDTGTGIPAERLEAVFQPFERLDAELAGVDGTGLGLAVARVLTSALGGELGAESTPGQGSTFWVELPHEEVPTEAALEQRRGRAPAPEATDASGTVLCVEDNPANLLLVQRILATRPGIRLLSAASGREGLRLARAQRPGVVLLDLNLPDLSGHDVLRALREDPVTRGIRVVVVSADATEEQVRRVLASGADAYVTKPYDISHLRSVVERMLDRGNSHAPAPHGPIG